MSPSSTALRSARSAALVLSLFVAGGCSQRTPAATCGTVVYQVSDPAEPANRAVFAFNRSVDDYLLAPVARGYSRLPGFARQGVHNFASNFGEPKVLVNDLLQGNGERAMTSLSRFIFNTTLGVAGLVDVSGKMGLSQHRSDFGQTFGVWGIAAGPIVELPLLGSHNLRDATGTLLGLALDPFGDNSDAVETLGNAAMAGGIVDARAEALPLTDLLRTWPDYYVAQRDYTAQRRANRVAEGKAGEPGTWQADCPQVNADE
ncbi:ABC transporter [Pseudomonas sp. AFG_SD02_1510_Pfu_092]|uniref:MlaA family lipoprotein n=1 Tax=Pseudomonas sp. AFG_SD02_1510_Pfu_092 TaxID=2259497 RepID=UPI000DEEFA60|nr:VacJ family lipoprotein [Pseudomonas sp. AFG_SD02_1510_Pfu_092]RCL24723.1 ABC transporter [Pseudomonas sp. AFG_SD02_1510_Pfu_092]